MARYIIDNRQSPIDFEIDGTIPRTIQNAKNLLMCHMGEVPYNRLRGFNPALYDLPIQEAREILLSELDAAMSYEPDAEVVDADCTTDENGEVYIRVTIEIDIDE